MRKPYAGCVRVSITVSFTLLAVCMLCCGCHLTRPNPPPATVTFVNMRRGRPPDLSYMLRLDLVNRHEQPIWFVMRWRADRPLPPSNRWVERPGMDIFQFVPTVLSEKERSDVYNWDKAPSFATEMLGGDNDFIALRLPAGKVLQIPDVRTTTRLPIHEFELWEVRDIRINDATPLQDWLASRTMAPQG